MVFLFMSGEDMVLIVMHERGNTASAMDIERLCLRLWYVGITMSLQIVLYTPKNPYLNQATQKYTCKIFLPKKILESWYPL